MLETVRWLVGLPTKHADVRCTIHNSGLRFVVETVKIKDQTAVSIEDVPWSLLDQATDPKALLGAAYERAVLRADDALANGGV